MELEEFMQLLKEKKLSEVKNSLLEMNEFDIASLIEELPEDKIVEFAKSDEFVTYKKLFSELGLS